MPQAASEIRIPEMTSGAEWPVRTQAVSFVGSACVVQGAGDFDLDDLNLVRHQFPGRRVTLDGDVITVWPTSSHGGRGEQHPSRSTPPRSVTGRTDSVRSRSCEKGAEGWRPT